MRFRKRKQYRPPVHDSLALDTQGEREAVVQESGAAVAQQRRAEASRESDPGQELVGALGDFKQEIAAGPSRDFGGTWRDDAMGHLVTGFRVAKREGWDELAQALADTGRILQTYVNGRRAAESAPLLESSYQVLSLMVGDRMAGHSGASLREQWQQHYQEALMAIKAAGLSLARDDNEDQAAAQRPKQKRAANTAEPTMNEEQSFAATEDWTDEEELPVLEELPPLESLLEAGIESESASAEEMQYVEDDVDDADDESRGAHGAALAEWVERGREAEEEADTAEDGPVLDRVSIMEDDDYTPEVTEAPAPVERAQAAAPPKIVVDILDRLCDQLRSIERTTGEERSLHLDRLSGAVSVLKREAHKHAFETAERTCSAMEDLCVLATASDGALNDRFMELAYAFGGVFMEAQEEGETKLVGNWMIEAGLLVENWESSPVDEAEVEDAEDEAPPVEAEAPATAPEADETEQAVEDEAPEEDPAQLTIESEPAVSAEKPAEAPVAEQPSEPVAPEPAVQRTPAERPVSDDSTSHELLQYAQKAAAGGDATGAKFLALRAAARFARDETLRAEQVLAGTEGKLRQSMESTEAAREQVKSAEEGVLKAATEVADGETSLGTIQERRGKIAQHLAELRSNAARIEEEIRALQEKLEAEKVKATQAAEQLESAREQEKNAEAQLQQLQSSEEQARLALEKRRQEVKDHQRSTLEIEAEMHAARDMLTQQRASLLDIEQTIEQIMGNENREKADAMLF